MNDNAVFGASWLELQLEEIFGATEVSNLIQLSGGANRETWSFEAITKEKQRSLIMQIDRGCMDRLHGTCERESRILQIAKLNGDGNFFEKSSLDARLKQFIKLQDMIYCGSVSNSL
mgnify:CR=1 FL=1